MRLSPVLNRQWLDQEQIPVFLGGAELNVAHALARWQMPVSYCTALPDHYLSREILESLREKGIDTSPVLFSGNRIGMYFIPQGADLKHDSVIYDRAASSFAELQPGMVNWDKALEDVDWLHFTAITPAISENLVAVCHEALAAAEKKGITISIDLNYRKKLWKYGASPDEVMPGLVAYADMVMTNIWSSNTLLGIPVDDQIHARESKAAYTDHAYTSAEEIRRQFPKCKTVANTFRFDRGAGIHYYATLLHGSQQYVSDEFNSKAIVDKAGSGDCFMAGLAYGFKNEWNAADVVNYAAAAAFGKLHEQGDATRQDVDAVKTIILQHG